jgi:hypothetical protein
MEKKSLSQMVLIKALQRLDDYLNASDDRGSQKSVELIVGGGSAMILAHHFPLATSDLDAIPRGGIEFQSLEKYIHLIAEELQLPKDWLNPYFSTFSHTLPSDYQTRLVNVFEGKVLTALALGKEEMLIMKCFAHRPKDVGHARALVRQKVNLELVENRLEELLDKRIPLAQKAIDFFQEICEMEGI